MAKVFTLVTDLFFQSRIQETARTLGIELETFANAAALLDRCRSEPPALLIVDLNAAGAQPLETISQIKQHPSLRAVPVVAYLSHVQAELERAARAAGADTVLPRSKFTRQLPDLLGSCAEGKKNDQP